MTEREQRRLAAIVSTDVVGYSRLMGADEAGTLARMKAHREELWTPEIEKFGGRIVGTAGDSLLVEFTSAVSAVECALAVQEGMAEREADQTEDTRMLLRIGVNIGEVVVDGDDIFGDGVNVAARLQAIAAAGGICISGKVHDEIEGKIAAAFDDAGLQEVKNISRPVQVWRWNAASASRPPAAVPASPADKPSIAVLSFTNMSGDPEQEYLSDGIAEDIITALSRFSWLKVIARNSSFTYKGKAVDLKQVGRDLGVRYVLEGSVRKAGNRVRVTAQLIEAETGGHVWAERYDRELTDIFDLQDEITRTITGTVAPNVEIAELNRSRRHKELDLDSWDLLLRARHELNTFDSEHAVRATALLRQALERDPDNVMILSHLALTLSQSVYWGVVSARQDALLEATHHAERALEIDRTNYSAMQVLGYIAVLSGEHEKGRRLIERAASINPNDYFTRLGLGISSVWNGEYELGIQELQSANALSPNDPLLTVAYSAMAFAYLQLGDATSAMRVAEQATEADPRNPVAMRMAAAACVLNDDIASGERYARRFLAAQPDFTLDSLKSAPHFSNKVDLSQIVELLRTAGVPE